MVILNGVEKEKISFEFINNLIIIPVTINNTPLNFIFDTGAAKTIIFSLTDSDSLSLNNTKKVELRGLGLGEPIEAVLSENNEIEIGKNIFGNNQSLFLVFDEELDLSSRMGKTIHGIIGFEFIKNFRINIDFNSKILTVSKPESAILQNLKKFKTIPLSFYQNKPYIDCELTVYEGINTIEKMLIDTGNSDDLWIFEDYKKGIVTPVPFFDDFLGEGLSGSIDGKRAKIKRLKFADFELKEPVAAFLDTTSTIYAKIFEQRNGSLGNGILSKFKVILDYPNQKMYLKKNRSFPKEFNYNRAGIELAYFGKTLVKSEKINTDVDPKSNDQANYSINFILDYEFLFKPIYGISRIRKNSPADLTGLKVNDVLYKINGKRAYEFKMGELIDLFYERRDDLLKIQVERKGMLYYYEIKMVDLL
jgi:hypothetical protein